MMTKLMRRERKKYKGKKRTPLPEEDVDNSVDDEEGKVAAMASLDTAVPV